MLSVGDLTEGERGLSEREEAGKLNRAAMAGLNVFLSDRRSVKSGWDEVGAGAGTTPRGEAPINSAGAG